MQEKIISQMSEIKSINGQLVKITTTIEEVTVLIENQEEVAVNSLPLSLLLVNDEDDNPCFYDWDDEDDEDDEDEDSDEYYDWNEDDEDDEDWTDEVLAVPENDVIIRERKTLNID